MRNVGLPPCWDSHPAGTTTLVRPPPFGPQLLIRLPLSGLFAAAFAAAFGSPTVEKPSPAAFDLPKCQ